MKMQRIVDREAHEAALSEIRNMPNRPKTYHIVTLGCQMNVRDSETIAGMLEMMGFEKASDREEADVIFTALTSRAKQTITVPLLR